MKQRMRVVLLASALLLQGCLLNSFLGGDSRLQLENGSRSTIAELEVVGPQGDVKLLIGDTLIPGARSRTRDIGLDGTFRLRLMVGDSSCFSAGCALPVDLGSMKLGGSLRYRFIVDRDGPHLEER